MFFEFSFTSIICEVFTHGFLSHYKHHNDLEEIRRTELKRDIYHCATANYREPGGGNFIKAYKFAIEKYPDYRTLEDEKLQTNVIKYIKRRIKEDEKFQVNVDEEGRDPPKTRSFKSRWRRKEETPPSGNPPQP